MELLNELHVTIAMWNFADVMTHVSATSIFSNYLQYI